MNHQQGSVLAVLAGSATGLLLASLLGMVVSACSESTEPTTPAPPEFWEGMYRHGGRYTERGRVPGGWIIMDSRCDRLLFVADPNHEWKR